MKKRLSSSDWVSAAAVLGILGLFGIVSFSLRIVSLSSSYGVIPAEIPIVPVSVADPGYHHYRETPKTEVAKITPTVAMTMGAFYFGDLESFSSTLGNTQDKFMIAHIDGEPQVSQLIDTMHRWLDFRARTKRLPIGDMLIFVPEGDIPMPIVMQVMAGLGQSPHFKRIILGSGII